MQLKAYLLQNPDAVDEDEPTYHHKFGALFRKSIHGSGWRWHERAQLRRELEETLVNACYWASIPTEPGDHTTYVPDHHFEARERPVSAPTIRLYDAPPRHSKPSRTPSSPGRSRISPRPPSGSSR